MKDDATYLHHILDSVAKVERYIADGEEVFKSDDKTQDAVIRNFEVIGEAVRNLSPELRNAKSAIPWRRISGMRDKLIHQYFGVNLERVWQTATRALPLFKAQVEEILNTLEAD